MKKGWETKTLGEIADVQSGGTPLVSNKAFWNGNLPWYSSGELNDLYTSPPERHVSLLGIESSNAKLFPEGSLLIGMYDTAALKMSILDRAGAFNQAIAGVRPNERIDLVFVLHAINAIRESVLGQRRGVRQKNLSLGKIREIPIPVPPLAEQQRIVGLLDEAFEGLATAKANAEKNLQNARALFESHLQSVFTQRGPGWVEKPLGEVAEVQSGGTPSVPEKTYWGGNIPWYSSGELNEIHTTDPERKITEAGLNNSNAKLFPKGALLIGMYDTAALKMSILDRDGTFNQAIAGVKPNERVEVEFILHAINAVKPRLLLERRGVRQKNLSLGKIKEIKIPIPLPTMQRAVVMSLRNVVAETQRLARIYERKLAALAELKKSLLHQAFTGEL